MPTLLDQFKNEIMEIIETGGEALVSEYVFAVGFNDGSVQPRSTADDVWKHLYYGGVLWFEIRPYNQPFTPGGYTRATNSEWELLQVAHDYDVESALNDTRGM